MTECGKKGRKRGSEGEERKGEGEGGRRKEESEGEERKDKDREESEKEREKGRERGRKEESEGERALLASVVHVARALYMNVTQDVAVGLSCILCTPMLDLLNTMHAYARFTEYHAPLRLILLYPVYDSDRCTRIFIKIANKFA